MCKAITTKMRPLPTLASTFHNPLPTTNDNAMVAAPATTATATVVCGTMLHNVLCERLLLYCNSIHSHARRTHSHFNSRDVHNKTRTCYMYLHIYMCVCVYRRANGNECAFGICLLNMCICVVVAGYACTCAHSCV